MGVVTCAAIACGSRFFGPTPPRHGHAARHPRARSDRLPFWSSPAYERQVPESLLRRSRARHEKRMVGPFYRRAHLEDAKSSARRGWDEITPDIDHDDYDRSHWTTSHARNTVGRGGDDATPANVDGRVARSNEEYLSPAAGSTGQLSPWERFEDAVLHGWKKNQLDRARPWPRVGHRNNRRKRIARLPHMARQAG
jgi:hypothetical protein